MARRTAHSSMPSDTPGLLRALGTCRERLIKVHAEVRPFGPAYNGAAMVVAAIDGFATFLTGHRYYFSADMHATPRPKQPEEEPPCP